MNKLHIKVDARGLGTTVLNEQDISDKVVAVGFNSEVGEPTEVTLVMRVDEVEIEAEVEDDHVSEPNHRNLEDYMMPGFPLPNFSNERH